MSFGVQTHGAKRLCIWQRHSWKEAVPGWQNLSAADILKIIHKMAAALWPTDTSNLATYDDETSLAFHKVAYVCWQWFHTVGRQEEHPAWKID